MMTGIPWHVDAKCRRGDPRDWDLDGKKKYDAERDSRLLCQGCPVIAECALDAALHRDVHVIRAGVCLWPAGRNRHGTGGQRAEDTRRLMHIATDTHNTD